MSAALVIFKLINVTTNNFFSILLLAIATYVAKYYIDYFNRPSKIPGPFPLPVIGNILQLGGDVAEATERFRKKYGEIFEFYTGNQRNIVISRPDLAEKVWGPLSIKTTNFILRNSYSEGIIELGLGTKGMLFNRDIESWATNRKFMSQISSPQFLREAVKISTGMNDEVFKYWKIMEEEGLQVEISEWMNALGTDVVVMSTMGKKMFSMAELFNKLNIKGKKAEIQGIWQNGVKFAESIHLYNESMFFMMLLPPFIRTKFPFKTLNKKFLDNRDWINNTLEKIVAEKRKEMENAALGQPHESTILTLLPNTNTEKDLDKGKLLTDERLGSILREVYTGGLDTTSNTLSFVTYYIAKHRDVYLKMREEIIKVYGTLDDPNLTFESYEKLKYIEAVIYEGIRIFPTIPIIGRAGVEDAKFDEFIIKADTTVYTDLKSLSNDPRYVKNPEKFDPDRFLNKEPIVRYSYLPFGNGVRMCPGRAWAMVQMKTYLVKLVSTFDIELVDKKTTAPKYVFATTRRPVDIKIHIKTRKD
nr:528_t:CDS:1 [Entrophospora candida]